MLRRLATPYGALRGRGARRCSVVALAATLRGGERRSERTGKHRTRNPERELRGGLAGRIGCVLGLRDDFVDAPLGLILRKARARRDTLRHIGAVSRRQATAAGQRAGHDTPGLFVGPLRILWGTRRI